MKRAFDVEIMGQRLTVSSDAEENYVHSVAGYVDGKMQQALKTAPPVARSNIAMLVALNIADEYHRLKERHEELLNRLGQLSRKLSNTLNEEG
ncbi:MAG TPA: cell division protein ZapA [Candidatus Binatia bacterium]|jgi:cell division protein ZapA|nr:cell division protein ZapA [Candidatus Binatia bacterium]